MPDADSQLAHSAPADDALRIAGLNLRGLFDRFPFAVQVYSPDGRTIYRNPAHTEMWGPRDESIHTRLIFDSAPLRAMGLMPYIHRGFSGETVALPVRRFTTAEEPALPDGRPIWVRTFIYPVRDEAGVMRAVVVIHIDVSEREQAQQLLEERVEERTREIATLLQVSQSAASNLEIGALLDVVLQQLKTVADYSGATIILVENGRIRILEDRGGNTPNQSNPELVGMSWPLNEAGLIWQTISRPEPVILDDAHGDSEMARAFRQTTSRATDTSAIRHVRSWLAVPLVTGDRVIGFIGISKDEPGFYTEQHARVAMAIATHVAAAIETARLFDEERRTSAELSTLVDVSRTVSSTLELEPLLTLVLDQLKLVMDYVSAVIITQDGPDEPPIMREYRGPLPREQVLARPMAPIDPAGEMYRALDRGEAFIIPDTWADTAAARAYREQMGEDYLRTDASYLRCLLAAPMFWKGENAGVLVLTHRTPGFYTERHGALAIAVAGQAAVAIENARLYEEQRQTSAELTSLLEVSHNLASTLDLDPLLDTILDQMKVVADYDGASIAIQEGDRLRELRRRLPEDNGHALGVDTEITRGWGEIAARRRPLMIKDIRGDEPAARAFRETIGTPLDQTWLHWMRSWMAVPLLLRDRLLGAIILAHRQPDIYTRHQAELAMAIAAQAAAAIDNAQLFGQAQRLAALEERQRLARELHDSVSQALFSIGLGARSTRTLLERGDPAKAVPSVEFILNLAEMGMAEMRALLFELRPESLEQEGLVAAISKQAAVLRTRHNIEVDADLGDEPDASLDVKEALYRIMQEATHNTVKHARATRVGVRLRTDRDNLFLEVQDNGQGFDATGSFPGHLGLRSMRERVSRLGGTLDLTSTPGQGTSIRVQVPVGH